MKELVAGPGTGILERRIEGRKVILDGRQATMGAEMPEQVAECVSNTIYTNPAEMLRTNSDVLPSLSLVRFGKVKPFVDGVFAALEEKISTPGFRLSRADFLTRLETDAIGFSDTPHRSAFQYVRALNLLGKPDKKYDQFTALMIKAITEDDPTFSVPQGFYQWTEELSLAYRQMKACAKDFDDDIITELKTQIQGKLKFRDKYKALLAFYSKMVNRLQKNASCLFPDSVLPDQEYFMKLSRETQSDIEGGLGKALVDAIKKGRLELEPSSDSGLYEYMLW